jgi:hypothetical protein
MWPKPARPNAPTAAPSTNSKTASTLVAGTDPADISPQNKFYTATMANLLQTAACDAPLGFSGVVSCASIYNNAALPVPAKNTVTSA